ncbi:MAG: RDD family protein [Candidatus Bathyarchaeia archaeon]
MATTRKGSSLKLADLGSRAVAAVVDHIAIIFAALLFRLVVSALMFPFHWAFNFMAFFDLFGLNWVLWVIYFTYFEGSQGQTPAKRWLRIKVVREDGSSVDYGAALIRNVLRIVDLLPAFYIIGVVLVALSGKRQRLGDIAARTLVVQA